MAENKAKNTEKNKSNNHKNNKPKKTYKKTDSVKKDKKSYNHSKKTITNNDKPQIIASITNTNNTPSEIKEHQSLQDKITPKKIESQPKQNLPKKESKQTKLKEKNTPSKKPILKNKEHVIKLEKNIPKTQPLKEQAQSTEKTISLNIDFMTFVEIMLEKERNMLYNI